LQQERHESDLVFLGKRRIHLMKETM
jgi:hypothetical protein